LVKQFNTRNSGIRIALLTEDIAAQIKKQIAKLQTNGLELIQSRAFTPTGFNCRRSRLR